MRKWFQHFLGVCLYYVNAYVPKVFFVRVIRQLLKLHTFIVYNEQRIDKIEDKWPFVESGSMNKLVEWMINQCDGWTSS